MIRVLINGIAGKMGQEVLRAVESAADIKLEAAVDLKPLQRSDFPVYQDLNQALLQERVDAVIDFTRPDAVLANIETCLQHRVPAVVGTTGLTAEELEDIDKRAEGTDWGVLVAPNFAIGAVLMMRFAAETARFFPEAEILEFHHQQKLDAPSGTALRTASMIAKARTEQPEGLRIGRDVSAEARGCLADDVPIHSIRLPGYVAHQEVQFGLPGQTLTIRHDSTHRESFMPGVLLAIRRIGEVQGVVVGLEHLLFS